jgi:hypothetical protein
MATGTISLVGVHLRTRLMDEIDMIRITEMPYQIAAD